MMDGDAPIVNGIDKNAEEILVTTSTSPAQSPIDLPRENDHAENNDHNNNNVKMMVGHYSKMPEILVHIFTKW